MDTSTPRQDPKHFSVNGHFHAIDFQGPIQKQISLFMQQLNFNKPWLFVYQQVQLVQCHKICYPSIQFLNNLS